MPLHQHERRHLLGLAPESLRELLSQWFGEDIPDYRVRQIVEWIYKHKVSSFEEMTNLPKTWQAVLSQQGLIHDGDVVHRQRAGDGTHKLLIRWCGGGTSECVLIPGESRMTACVSTQVGCPVKCLFCASGLGGLDRNLTAGQIVEQVLHLASLCDEAAPLTHVVFMGIGEPLANYSATCQALHIINADWGLGIGARKITVSTVGLANQIKRLADEAMQVTLALSLHAPTDELRKRLIPWAQRVSIAELVDACRYYYERTGREVTLEYILLEGVNNLPQHVEQLAEVSKLVRSNVNLIPYNPVADLGFQRPSDDSVYRFQDSLRRNGVNAHVRMSRGLNIDAACGQLRRCQESTGPSGGLQPGIGESSMGETKRP